MLRSDLVALDSSVWRGGHRVASDIMCGSVPGKV